MSAVHDQLLANFLRWESRGRGFLTFPEPVLPAPPFVPFPGHRIPLAPPPDDGGRPGLLARMTGRIARALNPPAGQGLALAAPDDDLQEPAPDWLEDDVPALVEIPLLLPEDSTVSAEAMAHFLSDVSLAEHPVTLELIGGNGQVSLQLCAHEEDAALLRDQICAHFPEILCRQDTEKLATAWDWDNAYCERAVVEFGLENPFMLPLALPGRADPFVGLAGALSSLGDDAFGIYQVTFLRLQEPWAENTLAAVTRDGREPFFDDGQDLVKATREKSARPWYGVIVRLAARAEDIDEVWRIIRRMAAPLRLFSRAGGNELAPVPMDDYPHELHCEDLLHRRCRRTGMILNLDELVGFVRFPSAAVRSPAFVRLTNDTRSADPVEPRSDSVYLGVNRHAGEETGVWLNTEQRVRHMHLIGASGSGKTTLMLNLLRQDMENGAGLALLDPHGDLVDQVLALVPEERIGDVVLLDPSDEEFVVPFNVLSAHSDFEKSLLASDLVAIFRAQSTSWGDQMNSVFGNGIRAFLESTEGGTLADLRRLLLDPDWRNRFLTTVTDPEIVFYWKRGFPQLGGNKSIGPVLTRLENFLSPKAIRYMVSQQENRLDFAGIMDSGKIFLARLPQGQMGKENSYLLGALIVAKLQQMAMSRQRMESGKRRPFFVYVDEFHNFICPSMAEILSGARKYRMGFILAHQDLRQLDRDKEVGAAVLSNAFTRVVFRVSDSDARHLSDGFAHFDPRALQTLPVGNAICRVERADNDFNLRVPLSAEPDEAEAAARRRDVITASRARIARPRADVEADLRAKAVPAKPANPPESTSVSAPSAEPPKPPEHVPPESKASPPPTASSGPPPTAAQPYTPAVPDAADPSSVPPVLPSRSPGTAGKGGPQHLQLQSQLKTAAEALGFRAAVEHPIGPGKETVDVALFRGTRRIACEISVTTPTDHELANARKCLQEDFDLIALITADSRRRTQLTESIPKAFSPADQSRIRCFSPEEFLVYLVTLPPEPAGTDPESPPTETVRGWKVKRSFTKLAPEEIAAKTRAAFELLTQEMKLPPDGT